MRGLLKNSRRYSSIDDIVRELQWGAIKLGFEPRDADSKIMLLRIVVALAAAGLAIASPMRSF